MTQLSFTTIALCTALLSQAIGQKQAPPAPADLQRAISRLTAGFAGKVFIYAKNLDSGAPFALAADERVRTASTIKLPIVCALWAQVAAGRMKWDEQITLRDADKVSGSGVLTEFSEGTTLTLRELANLMIVVSDNTAANLVLDRLTADAVNDYMDTLGLRQTRSNRKIRGDGTALKATEGWSKAGRLDENSRYGIGVSTPREMVALLEMLARGAVVNAHASSEILATLARQQYKDGIGRHAGDVEVASKSGALDHLRSDVGIAYTKRGRIAMAITVDDMPAIDYSPDNAGNRLISDIAQALMDGLGAPLPPPQRLGRQE